MHVQFEMPGFKDIQETAKRLLEPVRTFFSEGTEDKTKQSTLKIARVAASFFALAASGICLGSSLVFQSTKAALAATGLFLVAAALLPYEHRPASIVRLAEDVFGLCHKLIPSEPVVVATPAPAPQQEEHIPVGDHDTCLPSVK